MKRVVGSSLFAVFLLLLFAAAYFYFQSKKDEQGSVLSAVPSDALFLLTCHPGSGELRQLGMSDFLNTGEKDSWEYGTSRVLAELDSLSNNNDKWTRIFEQSPLYISGHHGGSGEVGVVYYIGVSQSQVASMDRLCLSLVRAKDKVKVRRFGQAEIHDLITPEGRSFSWTISQGVFICSFTPYLIEDALRQQAQEESSALVAAMPDFMEESGSSLNLAVRYTYMARFLQTQLNRESARVLKPLSRFGEWTILNLDISKGALAFQGQTLPADTFSFVRLFTSQRPVEWTITKKLPRSTVSCIAWAMDDPADFLQQLNREGVSGSPEDVRLRDHFKPWIGQEFAIFIQRQMTDSVRDQPLAIFRLRNEQACRSYLRLLEGKASSREESYHGTSIRLVQRPGVLKAVFGPVFEPVNRFYYSIIDGYLVVANQASSLRTYINGYKGGQLLTGDSKFRNACSKVPDKGNVLLYVDLSMFESKASGFLDSRSAAWVPRFASSAHRLGVFLFSMHQSNGIFLTQGVLEHTGSNRDTMQLKWSVPPDSQAVSPSAVLHNMGSLVISADTAGRISAFDAQGRINWTHDLGEPVLGIIHTVNSQDGQFILFNTRSHVHLFNSAGDPAVNFPRKLASAASTGLTPIMDEKEEITGFLLPCDNMRLMEYRDLRGPDNDVVVRKIPSRLKSPVVLTSSGSMLLHHVDGKLSILHKSNAITRVNDAVLFPDGRIATVRDKRIAGIFVSATDSSLWMLTQTSEVQPCKTRNREPSLYGLPGDVNGDGSPDWIIGGVDGVRVETADGLVLFRYRTGAVVDQLDFIEGKGQAFIAFKSMGNGYLLGRDGLPVKGWPVAGIEKMAFDFTGLQPEMSLAFRKGEIRQIRIL